MKFDLEVLPAHEGDCLLLHWADGDKQKLAVIDGGPRNTYLNTLKPRLQAIAKQRKQQPLYVDLVMVSHVDNDHIVGVREMFAEMRKELDGNVPANQFFLNVGRLWLNTFNDIIGDKTNAYYQKLTATYTATAGGGEDPKLQSELAQSFEGKGFDEDQADHMAAGLAAILAGHADAQALRKDYEVLKGKQRVRFTINNPVKTPAGKASLIVSPQKPFELDGLAIGLYGPADAEIEKLQSEYDKYLQEKGNSAKAMLAAYADDSARNLSSIVCLIGMQHPATGGQKSILFTGDARGDKVIEGLKQAGVLKEKLFVNVLKVPHHGSDRNVAKDFFETITANTYVISADGKYGNPDRATIEWIVGSRSKNDQYEIVLTYPVADIDKMRKAEFEKAQKRKAEDKRRAWEDATDSLAVFFEEKKAQGYKFKLTVGNGKKSLLVKLGDE